MREVKTGGQFRKDLKRYRNDKTKLEKQKSLNLICFQVIMQVTWNVT